MACNGRESAFIMDPCIPPRLQGRKEKGRGLYAVCRKEGSGFGVWGLGPGFWGMGFRV